MLIYLIENTINNKKYIGQTSKTVEKRWRDHIYNANGGSLERRAYPLYHAIRKYGPESFKITTVDTAQTQEELDNKEKYYIRKYRTLEKEFGYNRHEGGLQWDRQPTLTPKDRTKAGLSLRGRKFTKEHREKISKALKGKLGTFIGRKHSEQTKLEMSVAQKERCAKFGGSRLGLKSSPEHIEKIRIANTGKHHSEETKKRISLAKTNPSKETIKRLRESHEGKPWSSIRVVAYLMKTVAWG